MGLLISKNLFDSRQVLTESEGLLTHFGRIAEPSGAATQVHSLKIWPAMSNQLAFKLLPKRPLFYFLGWQKAFQISESKACQLSSWLTGRSGKTNLHEQRRIWKCDRAPLSQPLNRCGEFSTHGPKQYSYKIKIPFPLIQHEWVSAAKIVDIYDIQTFFSGHVVLNARFSTSYQLSDCRESSVFHKMS